MSQKTSRKTVHLRGANLNLFPVLRALLREISVTRAAQSLALSPSATSCALADLRLLLNDPLLVRVGRGMRLTPKAEALIGKVECACMSFEDLLHEDAFEPGAAWRTFVVATPDYFPLLLGPALVSHLRRQAPGIRIRFIDPPADLERQLVLGAIDLGLVAVNFLNWSGVTMGSRFQDRMVGLVDANHTLAKNAKPNASDLAGYPMLGWDPGLALAARAGAFERADALDGPLAQCLVNSFSALPMMVLGSEIVARVPATLAQHAAARFALHMFELPYDPLVIETGLIWNVVHDSDPAHCWLRELLTDRLAQAHEELPGILPLIAPEIARGKRSDRGTHPL